MKPTSVLHNARLSASSASALVALLASQTAKAFAHYWDNDGVNAVLSSGGSPHTGITPITISSEITAPLFPALRSGHRLFQRPSPKSKFLAT